MQTDEELEARERVRFELRLSHLDSKMKRVNMSSDYATPDDHSNMREVAESYGKILAKLVDGLAQLDLELAGTPDVPEQQGYRQGLEAARKILRGQV